MLFKGKLLLLLNEDSSVQRLLLLAIAIISPLRHFLSYAPTGDQLSLRLLVSALCLLTFVVSFYSRKLFVLGKYGVVLSSLTINNGLLLAANGFAPQYVVNALITYVALTFLCRDKREFVAFYISSAVITIISYTYTANLNISHLAFSCLLVLQALVAYASYTARVIYQIKLAIAIKEITDLNNILIENDERLRENRKNLDALINSLNDIIFEFDENKTCLNVWFSNDRPRVTDLNQFVGKTLEKVLSEEKAAVFNEGLDSVIRNKKPVAFEFISLFGTGSYFLAKLAPVFDKDGNYCSRISATIINISEQKKYERALKENEALLMEAQLIAKMGNWWFDAETRENYWSENLFKILECDRIPENVSNFEYYLSLVHPDDIEAAKLYFETITTTAEKKFEHKIITPRGNTKYISILRGELVNDNNGKLKRIVGIVQDITETKQAEKIIKKSQFELLEAQTIAKIGNWKWNVDRKELKWSDEINHIFEIEPYPGQANFIRPLLKQVHPADKDIIHTLFNVRAEISQTPCEFRILTSNGKIKYLSVIVGKLLFREDGSVGKVIGTLQDITERKNAELESEKTENKYKLVLENIKLIALSLNKDGDIIFCNKYLAKLLGYDQQDLRGLNLVDNFIPDEFKPAYKDWFKTGIMPMQFVNPIVCRNGEQRVISWQNTVSYDEYGNINSTTSIGEDITEQQKATRELIDAKEQAERTSEFKSEFLSVMSHEIRTPMNAVIGTTNLLLAESPNPEQLEYLNTLKFSGESLLNIINDILDYNKIEANKIELSYIQFNLRELVENIKRSFVPKAVEQELDLEIIFDQTLPVHLTGDPSRLSQILNNLVSNAIKFTNKGKVSIQLIAEGTGETQVTIKFIVTDTGIGIAAENLAKIFEPFTQESHITHHDFGGTGLGLAITKKLIELHRSTITVKSVQDIGTEFTFAIAFDIAKQPDDQQQPSRIQAEAYKNLKGMKLLLVDDNKMNLMIASKFLKKWEVDIDEATNGQIAIDMARSKNYDVLIMDLQMPVMDGFEATMHIRMTHPDLPIIALTADAMPETYTKAFEAGMNDYLTKPFSPEALFKKVSKYYNPASLLQEEEIN